MEAVFEKLRQVCSQASDDDVALGNVRVSAALFEDVGITNEHDLMVGDVYDQLKAQDLSLDDGMWHFYQSSEQSCGCGHIKCDSFCLHFPLYDETKHERKTTVGAELAKRQHALKSLQNPLVAKIMDVILQRVGDRVDAKDVNPMNSEFHYLFGAIQTQCDRHNLVIRVQEYNHHKQCGQRHKDTCLLYKCKAAGFLISRKSEVDVKKEKE